MSVIAYLIRRLPLGWALAVGRAIGWVWYHLVPIRRGVARRNLAAALGETLSAGEQRRVLKQCFAHLCMNAVEGLRFGLLTPELGRTLVQRFGFEHLEQGLAQGRGVIVVMAHLGNFELAGASLALEGVIINAPVREIRFGGANALWNELRHRTGLKTIAPRNSIFDIRRALRRGEVVCFLIDQHMPQKRGVVCSFFGRLASTTPAPVLFALTSGAPIVPAVTYRDGVSGHHRLYFAPPFQVETPYAERTQNVWHNTERLNRLVEDWIRRAPEQWLWLHRRWKVHDRPEGWDIPPVLAGLRK